MKRLFLTATCLAIFITLLASGLHGILGENDKSPFGDFGKKDLVSFWSGVHTLSQGQSPYDQDALAAAKKITATSGPRTTHNPPWTLLLLYPIISTPFSWAIMSWFFLNMLLLLLSAGLAQECFPVQSPVRSQDATTARRLPQGLTEPMLLLSALCFIPTYIVLAIGQLTIFILFFLLLSLTLMRHRWDFCAGLALVPVLMKPHLVSLVLVGLCIKALMDRRYKYLAGFIAGAALLACATECMRPGVFIEWMNSASSAHNQQNSTLVTLVRQIIHERYGFVPLWPVVAIPLAAITATTIWITRARERFNLETSLPYLLCLSLLFAPHAWLYDYVLLICLFVPLFDLCRRTSVSVTYRLKIAAMLAFSQLAIVVASIFDTRGTSYFWFPALMLLIWHCATRMQRKELPGGLTARC
ncbi:MAG: DUF2029 domain-containing protein [Deltaproteobacteria bacterium]|nr:DUF2029 domain-containing protein [Deltaproteobacteria bacterium]